jgi:hypothetical protein
VVTFAVAAAAAMASFGIASAAGGGAENNAAPDAPAVVPATPSGMPPTAQVMFGVVNANGTLARGFGATAATRIAVGTYRVTYRQDVTGCAFNGTIGLAGSAGVSPAGEIQVVGAAGFPNAVFVTTTNSAGDARVDRGFHLSVDC